MAMIRKDRLWHFDWNIVDAFEAVEVRFVAIWEQIAQREEHEAQSIAPQPAELVLS